MRIHYQAIRQPSEELFDEMQAMRLSMIRLKPNVDKADDFESFKDYFLQPGRRAHVFRFVGGSLDQQLAGFYCMGCERYPGIDLASGLYQDIAAERRDAFTAWLAEKWIDKNARCNRIFQRDPRRAAWEGPPDEGMLQCSELNRPSQDLKPMCSAPATAQWSGGILRLRWLCTMAPNTAPFLYEESNPSPKVGVIALAVNPASKERSRIPIEAPTP